MMKRVIFHPYAEYKLRVRNLDKSMIMNVLESPKEIVKGKFGRKIAQKIVGRHMLRVIFEEYPDYLLVITAYPTRKGRY